MNALNESRCDAAVGLSQLAQSAFGSSVYSLRSLFIKIAFFIYYYFGYEISLNIEFSYFEFLKVMKHFFSNCNVTKPNFFQQYFLKLKLIIIYN